MATTRALLTTGVVYLRSLFAGNGSSTYVPGGIVARNTTQVATGANTDATTLATYTIPANTLVEIGDTMRVWVRVHFAANGNTKTVTFTIESTTITLNPTTTTPNNATLTCMVDVARISSTALTIQIRASQVGSGAQAVNNAASETVDFTGTIVMTLTGTNGSASASDIVLPINGFQAEFLT